MKLDRVQERIKSRLAGGLVVDIETPDLELKIKIIKKKIEEKGGNKGPVASVLGNVGGMVMGIKDRVMNFFGYLLMGFVVKKLPDIISFLSSASLFFSLLLNFIFYTPKKKAGSPLPCV